MKKQEIVYKKIEDLIPYARNSRTHSEQQITELAALIKEFGFRGAILVDGDNGIITGHGRILACKKLGMKEIPTVDGSDMTPAQRKAYIIADNKIALNAGWDYEMLQIELNELQEEGFNLDLLAFSDKELDFLQENETNDGINDDVNMGESYEIIVECISEYEQRTLLERLTNEGLKCKSLLR